jgi:hypothetical protein
MSRNTRNSARLSPQGRDESTLAQRVAAETPQVTSEELQEPNTGTRPKTTDQFQQQEERNWLQNKYKKPVGNLLRGWKNTTSLVDKTTKEALMEGEALISLLASWEKEIISLIRDEEHRKTQLQVLEQTRNSATDNDLYHKFINLSILDELRIMSMRQELEFHENAWTRTEMEETRAPWSAEKIEELFRAQRVKLSNGRNENEELFTQILRLFQEIMEDTETEQIIERVNIFLAPLRPPDVEILSELNHSWGNRIIDTIIEKTEDEHPCYGRSALIQTLTEERKDTHNLKMTSRVNKSLPTKDTTTNWLQVTKDLKNQVVFDKSIIDDFRAGGMNLNGNKRSTENNSGSRNNEPAKKKAKSGKRENPDQERETKPTVNKQKGKGGGNSEGKRTYTILLPNPLPENLCNGCGMVHRGQCSMKDVHPDFNKSNNPFHLSEIGIKSMEQNTPYYRKWNVEGDKTEYRLPCLSHKFQVGKKERVEIEDSLQKEIAKRHKAMTSGTVVSKN